METTRTGGQQTPPNQRVSCDARGASHTSAAHQRRTRMSGHRPTRLRDAALAAAASGLYVFPCIPGGKVPDLHGAGHCDGRGPCSAGHQGWEQLATRDPAQIRRWWDHKPTRNIGAAVGRSNLVVIDLDHGRGEPAPEQFPDAASGMDVLEVLAQRVSKRAPWDTYTVSTPTGGLHLYFRAPAGSNLRNTAGEGGATGLGWKIDTRAHGGFVVAAGSVRREGRYRVVNHQPIAALPRWLADALTKPVPAVASEAETPSFRGSDARVGAYVRAILTGEADAVRNTGYGQGRNNALNRAAFNLGRLVGGGELDENTAWRTLLDAASAHVGVKDFTEAEARRTIASGLSAGQLRPRRLKD